MGDINKEQFDEYKSRVDAEDKRQNHRLDRLEESVREIGKLASSIDKMAVSMESMLKEQISQGDRLKTLESRDGEMWRSSVKQIILCVIAGVVGYALSRFGI